MEPEHQTYPAGQEPARGLWLVVLSLGVIGLVIVRMMGPAILAAHEMAQKGGLS